jgi:uncharacterized glyoxalase superfamily protein PhnB
VFNRTSTSFAGSRLLTWRKIFMTTQIKSTIPVLASLNLSESVSFYTDRLGFTKISQYDDYAIVARDGAEIHFWPCPDRNIADNTSCYIRVTDTQRLFEEFTEKGAPVNQPTVRPWGMKELYVIDPHGNLLKFGEPV